MHNAKWHHHLFDTTIWTEFQSTLKSLTLPEQKPVLWFFMGRFCHSISLIYQEPQWWLAGFKTQFQSCYPINSVIVLKNTSHEPEIQPVQSLNLNI